jgi:hypothetical protein
MTHLPSPQDDPLPAGWFKATHELFDEIHWTFHFPPCLVHNGISLSPTDIHLLLFGEDVWSPFSVPGLSFFDSAGNLPLTLKRDELTTSAPNFLREILPQMVEVFCASLLVNAPVTKWTCTSRTPYRFGFIHPDAYDPFRNGRLWIYARTPNGSIPFYGSCLRKTHIRECFIFPSEVNVRTATGMFGKQGPSSVYDRKMPREMSWGSESDVGPASTILQMLPQPLYSNRLLTMFDPFLRKHGVMEMSGLHMHRVLAFAAKSSDYLQEKSSRWRHKFLRGANSYELASNPDVNNEQEIVDRFGDQQLPERFVHVRFEPQLPNNSDAIVDAVFNELLPDPLIPYDLVERRHKFAHAYTKLAPLIAKWEASSPSWCLQQPS